VRLAVTGREREVELTVHNDGPPIPPELLPHIFEPFRRGQAQPGAAAGSANLGLGLFIVREIVTAHGGRLEVRSEAGAGTTFTAVLPRAPAGA
jgi:signal transduction histidine kinase